MHIVDSICSDCKHFEHECDFEMCLEYCTNSKPRTRNRFSESSTSILKCGDFTPTNSYPHESKEKYPKFIRRSL